MLKPQKDPLCRRISPKARDRLDIKKLT